MTHGETNPNDPNYYWDANFNKWILKPGSPTGGANLTLTQALQGQNQTQGDQDAASNLVGALTGGSQGGPPLSPPGGGLATTSGGSDPGQMGMPTQPQTHTPSGAGIRLEKNGEVYFKTDPGEIGQLLQQGYQVRDGNDPNGQLYTPKSFQGGYLLKSGNYWVPVDTLLNGRMTPAQRDALKQGGFELDPDVQVTGGPTDMGTGGGGGGGTGAPGTTTSAPLSGSLSDMLKDLMQRSLDQGRAGQDALKPLIDALTRNATTNQANSEADRTRRDDLVSQLLGGDTGLNAGYNSVIANMNQGLDPLTMAALNQQAIEGPQRDYQGQVEALKTSLGQRGAYGGGDTPGDLGAILGGYSPLLTARDTTRQGLMQQNAFANQAQKNTNLSAGLSALGEKSSLLGTLGGIYNPNTSAGLSQSALSGALSGQNASNATGFQGLNTAANLGGVLNDASTGSLSSLLKSSLLGTGLGALTTKTSSGKSLLGSLLGLIPGLGGPTGNADTKSALENYLDNSIGPNWRQSINSDQIEFLLGQIPGQNPL